MHVFNLSSPISPLLLLFCHPALILAKCSNLAQIPENESPAQEMYGCLGNWILMEGGESFVVISLLNSFILPGPLNITVILIFEQAESTENGISL